MGTTFYRRRTMTPQSAKAKGRLLQQKVVAAILARFPNLQKDDVRSTSMGAGGEDVQLSPLARSTIGKLTVECKSRSRVAIYPWYFQCLMNAPKDTKPLLVVKQNNAKPLACVDFEDYMDMVQELYQWRTGTRKTEE